MAGSISAFVGNAEMNFRSYADLARTISMAEVLSSIRFDVVVGVPRSGMVPASMIA